MLSVLFVSHDTGLGAAATRALRRAGVQLTPAAHAGHASLACVAKERFDVLVVENRMPEATGEAIARRLRRYCPELRIVRMCDRQAESDGEGIAIVRPFTADDLLDAVIRAAAHATPLADVR